MATKNGGMVDFCGGPCAGVVHAGVVHASPALVFAAVMTILTYITYLTF